mmetsp:Transcript_15395/g.29000  ORF Transcript_15395/g.29000 Transcript_15395/m.29000 type:complete len:222 (+) Transcript_15395:1665-2330(+)
MLKTLLKVLNFLSKTNNKQTNNMNRHTISSCFHVYLTGQIEEASDFQCPVTNLYCQYCLSYGEDWRVVHGVTSSVTQMAYSQEGRIVWNFPIELALRSTNAYGWPRICFALYGLDFFGRDVVRGYGSLLIPTFPGRHELTVEMYRPVSGSKCHEFMNWWRGTIPEYYETTFTARSEGRELTRVMTDGRINVILNVMTKDMEKFGFTNARNNRLLVDDKKSN